MLIATTKNPGSTFNSEALLMSRVTLVVFVYVRTVADGMAWKLVCQAACSRLVDIVHAHFLQSSKLREGSWSNACS